MCASPAQPNVIIFFRRYNILDATNRLFPDTHKTESLSALGMLYRITCTPTHVTTRALYYSLAKKRNEEQVIEQPMEHIEFSRPHLPVVHKALHCWTAWPPRHRALRHLDQPVDCGPLGRCALRSIAGARVPAWAAAARATACALVCLGAAAARAAVRWRALHRLWSRRLASKPFF